MNNLNFSFYKTVVILISSYFIIKQLYNFFVREQFQSFIKFITVIIIWSSIIVFISVPGLSHFISENLGLGENLNTLIFTGFIVVFILIFKFLSIIEKLERNITEIVRKEALKELKF